jgi:hypothetical protein
MTDTLKTLIKVIESKSSDSIDLLNKVDSFYNSAWDKLILIGTLSFAVVGIVVPFVIQWYQKKTLKLSEDLLKKEIENQTIKIKEEIIQELNQKLEEKINEYEEKINVLNASTNAKAFHIQGNIQIEKGFHQLALADYVTAAFDYLICDDYQNLQTVLNSISTNCIAEISIEEIEDLKTMTGSDIFSLIEELEKKNNNGALTRIIRDIRMKLQKAPKTIKDKPEEK